LGFTRKSLKKKPGLASGRDLLMQDQQGGRKNTRAYKFIRFDLQEMINYV
jgi:hypothetical protein